jgi:SOS-response transcriptional repressor LexA
MRKLSNKRTSPAVPEWAASISSLRERLDLSQTDFGQRLDSSAMAVSRWERGAQEPPARSYIDLGNLAGAPDCWYFWARAGLRVEDVMRVMPKLRTRLRGGPNFEIVNAGAGKKLPKNAQLVAIPLLKVVAAAPGEKGDNVALLDRAPIESMIAAPHDWCPNPGATSCLRVLGDSMNPLICDGYIVAVDSSQNDRTALDGKIVIAWNKDVGLTVSRFQKYDHTEILQSENRQYRSMTMDGKKKWKIIAKVLWWIGKAP